MNKINTLFKTKEILRKFNLKAKKKFGQNFLVNDNILKNIVDVANCNKEDLIIEIGPGLGNLTEYMIESNLLLIEIDEDMIEILNERFNDKKITLINKDILKINIDEEIEKLEDIKGSKFRNIKVVANLPYYITSPIIFKLLEDSKRIEEIIVMVQEEVADRIVADIKSKDYGILTLMIKYFGIATKEIKVLNSAFIPAPNVTSAVVKIKLNDSNKNINYNIFKELVHKAFANRRKKMINSLLINKFNNCEKKELEEIFNNLNINLNTRAEELKFEEYVRIIDEIEKMYDII